MSNDVATELAVQGQSIVRDQDRKMELEKSRIQHRKAMDRRYEWQFLWTAIQESLEALNPWVVNQVPEAFTDLEQWTFEMIPFQRVPIFFKYVRDRNKIWSLARISYPQAVKTSGFHELGDTTGFGDWRDVSEITPERLKVVLAYVYEMEKRIAENTSDHA